MENELYNHEDIYDNEISPLVKQIIEICNKNKIPMICSFAYENNKDDGIGFCTSVMNDYPSRYIKEYSEARNAIRGEQEHYTFGLAISK